MDMKEKMPTLLTISSMCLMNLAHIDSVKEAHFLVGSVDVYHYGIVVHTSCEIRVVTYRLFKQIIRSTNKSEKFD